METELKFEKKYPPLDLAAPVIFAIVFVITFMYSRFEPNVEDVDSNYVKKYKDLPGYILVDARSRSAYEGKSPRYGIPGGHIEGAVNFPVSELSEFAAAAALAKTGITKNKTVIIYCSTGMLSGRFADQLVRRFNHSASKVKNYRGSIADWVLYPENVLLPEGHETGFEKKPENNERRK